MSEQKLSRRDLGIALTIAAVMATLFVAIGGKPLLVTFCIGLVGVAGVLVWFYRAGAPLPGAACYPVYFATLAWQFVHFTEEYLTGFNTRFPELYGASPYSHQLFVIINMTSYAVFSLAAILMLTRRFGFMLTPMLFFVIYGAIGNAIAHSWWVIMTVGYFPGAFTAQLYWALGPLALWRLTGSAKATIITIAGMAAALIPILTLAQG